MKTIGFTQHVMLTYWWRVGFQFWPRISRNKTHNAIPYNNYSTMILATTAQVLWRARKVRGVSAEFHEQDIDWIMTQFMTEHWLNRKDVHKVC